MRKILSCILLAATLTQITGCDSTGADEPRELVKIYGLGKKGGCGAKIGSVRKQGLKEAAMSLGAQAGLQWRAEQIDCTLKEQRKRLDDIYQFPRLMLRDHVMPPVLSEGRYTMNLSSCSTIRTSDTVYRIVRPPCFVSLPPNWREYLWLKYTTPDEPNVTLLPKNRDEAAFWNCYVKKGWDKGIDQANAIFIANLNRLNRDYMGMILYHRLYAQNMVTAPFVSKAELGVTGDGKEMRINDRVLRIAETSVLNRNTSQWRTAVWPLKIVKLDAAELAKLPHTMEELPGPTFINDGAEYRKDGSRLPEPGMGDVEPLDVTPGHPAVPRRLMRNG